MNNPSDAVRYRGRNKCITDAIKHPQTVIVPTGDIGGNGFKMESKVKQLLTECGYCFYTTVGIGLRAQKREDLTDIREPFFGSWVYPSGAAFGPFQQHRCLDAYAGNRYTADDLIEKFGEEAILQAIQSAN